MFVLGSMAIMPLDGARAGVTQWVERNRGPILQDYVRLLAIPNVAGDRAGLRRNADHLAAMMEQRGLAPRLLENRAGGPPAVYGEWLVPGARETLVFYAHYDGQPVDPSDWDSAPFNPTLRTGRHDRGGAIVEPRTLAAANSDWRLYARSAADDKAGVMAILAAVDALKANGLTPEFNLKIFYDGEEESGSPGMAGILKDNEALLRSDGWLIVDGPAHPGGSTQAVLGVRGVVTADITVHGPSHPLHSGHYGNWAPNPALMLSRLLASMKDEEGRVLVEGFYDDVVPLSDAELAAARAVPAADADLKAELGLGWTEGGGRPLSELIHAPSLNVDGIRSADVGPSARNVIPSSATATIDMRLVKGNDPQRQLALVRTHIEQQGYLVLDRAPSLEERRRHPRIATMVSHDGYPAARTPIDHRLARRLIEGAAAAGPLVVLPSTGGSLPLSVIEQTLNAPTATLSPWNHDSHQHAENENLRLGDFWEGIAAVAAVMTAKP